MVAAAVAPRGEMAVIRDGKSHRIGRGLCEEDGWWV